MTTTDKDNSTTSHVHAPGHGQHLPAVARHIEAGSSPRALSVPSQGASSLDPPASGVLPGNKPQPLAQVYSAYTPPRPSGVMDKPRPPVVVGTRKPFGSPSNPLSTQGTGTQGKTRDLEPGPVFSTDSLPQEKGRNAARFSVSPVDDSLVQQTQESSGSDGSPLIIEAKTLAIRRATRRARRLRTSALRFTGGQRRQMGVQARAPTSDTSTQTIISRPQRVDIVWQSHVFGPSAHVDSRPSAEQSDVESEDFDDNFESALDPRRSTNIQGPRISEIDSLEVHSDDSFFNFDELDRVEVQEETTENIAEIDSDSDIMPEADFSSTDDETSTNARIRRNSEKRRICRRVRVQRAIHRIEEIEQPRSVIHPFRSDADCCPSLMMPGEDEELQQHASKGTLKAKPSELDAPDATKEEKAKCFRLRVEHMRASTAKESGVAGLATGIDIRATMWSGWRRLLTDHMSIVWMRSMQRIGHSVAAVFLREKAAGLCTGDDPVPACSDEYIYVEIEHC